MRHPSGTAAAAFLALAAPFFAAAASIVPGQPTEFETVNLRITTDDCTFVPSSVHVTAVANTLRVTQQMNACLLPGAPRVVDIRLGALPIGRYDVELHGTQQPAGEPIERLSFEVLGRIEIAVFPPPPRPITDYSGMWWNAQESGWGLSLHQSVTNAMFGTLFVYDVAREPEWFALPGGRWTDSTNWTSTIYRTTGPWFGAPFDPRQVTLTAVGNAAFDFTQVPGEEGRARFTYTIDGVTRTKVITRMAF